MFDGSSEKEVALMDPLKRDGFAQFRYSDYGSSLPPLQNDYLNITEFLRKSGISKLNIGACVLPVRYVDR